MLVQGNPSWEGPPVDHGGGGGDNEGMEARVSRLEAMIPNLSTKLDLADLRTATKLDLADLRTEMHKEFNVQTWRIIGVIITFGGILSAVTFFIARNVK